MKHSIKHLPERTQKQLDVLKELILKHMCEVRMIILYGSYARGNYVLYDQYRDTYGAIYSYQSDFDILVITGVKNAMKESCKSSLIYDRYMQKLEYLPYPAPPEIIVENTGRIDNVLADQLYFFTDIIKEGIVLYDDKQYILPKVGPLSHRRIKERALMFYDEAYTRAEEFAEGANFYKDKEKWKLSAFMFHQACENFLKALGLVLTHYHPRSHKLDDLIKRVWDYSPEVASVFPVDTPEKKAAFEKLCDAYIGGRYDRDFTVSEFQMDYMVTRTEALHQFTCKLCAERLAYYEAKAQEEETK